MADAQKITTFLWFDDNAEEAMDHYTGIFTNSKVNRVVRNGEGGPGSARVCDFQLEGRDFAALNGGPMFRFTEAISLVANCDSQDEEDTMWSKLSDGGAPGSAAGWRTDSGCRGRSFRGAPRSCSATRTPVARAVRWRR